MFRIHFPFRDPRKPLLPIAAACGVGPLPAQTGIAAGRFRDLMRRAPGLFESAPLDGADVVFYPHCFSPGREVLLTAKLAQSRELPCIFVKHGDDSAPIPVPYGIVYKQSILRSTRLPHERVIPPFVDDPFSAGAVPICLNEYQAIPRVGFCGFTGSRAMLPAYKLLGRGQKLLGLVMRRKAIRVLTRSRLVAADIIQRRQYWGGAVGLTNRRLKLALALALGRQADVEATRDEKREAIVYREFLSNMLASDYTLCVRGAGNYSYRFYETLAAARVPLFVDSDCVLPFASEINWREHCVWVSSRDIPAIAEKVLAFHSALGPSRFRELQMANRQIFEKYFAPVSFYSRMLRGVTEQTGAPRAEVLHR